MRFTFYEQVDFSIVSLPVYELRLSPPFYTVSTLQIQNPESTYSNFVLQVRKKKRVSGTFLEYMYDITTYFGDINIRTVE